MVGRPMVECISSSFPSSSSDHDFQEGFASFMEVTLDYKMIAVDVELLLVVRGFGPGRLFLAGNSAFLLCGCSDSSLQMWTQFINERAEAMRLDALQTS